MADFAGSMVMGVAQLLESEISRNIGEVIRQCLKHLQGPSQDIDVSLFLDVARTNPARRGGAQDILSSLFKRTPELYKVGPKSEVPASEARLSPGLSAAFAEAREIRSRTGGQDDYLGLRHVLFAILTSQNPATRQETDMAFERSAGNRRDAEQAIVRYCDTQMETEEDREAWNAILAERNLPPMRDRPPPPSTQWRGPEIALLGSDDPWDKGAIDRSGAVAEANAFAAMIGTTQFKPPLAIGVFGEWGSGKSFFMRLVHDAVEANAARADPGTDDGEVTPLRNIVQIRFNAWHYQETNLWASLVDHIFTCLDRWAEQANQQAKTDALFGRLSTARKLTIESAEMLAESRRARDLAEQQLKDAQTRLEDKRQTLSRQPQVWAQTAFNALFPAAQANKKNPKEELRDAATLLGLGDATQSVEVLQAAGQELGGAVAQYGIIASATVRQLILPGVVIGVSVAVLVFPPALAWLFNVITSVTHVYLPPIAAAVSGALAPVVAVIGFATKKTQDAADKVRAFHNKLNVEIEKLAANERAAAEVKRMEVEVASVRVSEAEERLRLASEEVALAASDYNLKNGKGRVLRFVRDRVEKGDYAKHLGFIATVRKDFEELSALMAPGEHVAAAEAAREAHKAQIEDVIARAGANLQPEEQQKLRDSVVAPDASIRVFERIVLYVDDLDRCPPKQVVEVLQALHLLLTFPLFVVFVAIDVRWVREALAAQYPRQIADAKDSTDQQLATAGDYLEKIFQIPYWVRAMTADNTRQLLNDRLGPEPIEAGAEADKPAEKRELRQEVAPNPAFAAEPQAPAEARRRARSLLVTPEERRFMGEVAAILDHSPRRTLRFVNSYRLIKASFGRDDMGDLETGGYRSLLTLLAIGTCGGDEGARFIASLCDGSLPPLRELKSSTSDEAKRLHAARVLYGPGKGDSLLKYAKHAARFSFGDRNPAPENEKPVARPRRVTLAAATGTK